MPRGRVLKVLEGLDTLLGEVKKEGQRQVTVPSTYRSGGGGERAVCQHQRPGAGKAVRETLNTRSVRPGAETCPEF